MGLVSFIYSVNGGNLMWKKSGKDNQRMLHPVIFQMSYVSITILMTTRNCSVHRN